MFHAEIKVLSFGLEVLEGIITDKRYKANTFLNQALEEGAPVIIAAYHSENDEDGVEAWYDYYLEGREVDIEEFTASLKAVNAKSISY